MTCQDSACHRNVPACGPSARPDAVVFELAQFGSSPCIICLYQTLARLPARQEHAVVILTLIGAKSSLRIPPAHLCRTRWDSWKLWRNEPAVDFSSELQVEHVNVLLIEIEM